MRSNQKGAKTALSVDSYMCEEEEGWGGVSGARADGKEEAGRIKGRAGKRNEKSSQRRKENWCVEVKMIEL